MPAVGRDRACALIGDWEWNGLVRAAMLYLAGAASALAVMGIGSIDMIPAAHGHAPPRREYGA